MNEAECKGRLDQSSRRSALPWALYDWRGKNKMIHTLFIHYLPELPPPKETNSHSGCVQISSAQLSACVSSSSTSPCPTRTKLYQSHITIQDGQPPPVSQNLTSLAWTTEAPTHMSSLFFFTSTPQHSIRFFPDIRRQA